MRVREETRGRGAFIRSVYFEKGEIKHITNKSQFTAFHALILEILNLSLIRMFLLKILNPSIQSFSRIWDEMERNKQDEEERDRTTIERWWRKKPLILFSSCESERDEQGMKGNLGRVMADWGKEHHESLANKFWYESTSHWQTHLCSWPIKIYGLLSPLSHFQTSPKSISQSVYKSVSQPVS